MKKIIGTFLGTGADLYLGLGGIPSKVTLTNIQSASDNNVLTWTRKNAGLVAGKGGTLFAATGATAFASKVYTVALGIEPYVGEDVIASAAVAYQQLVQGPTGIDPVSPLGNTSLGGDLRTRGAGAVISKWTLDTAANFTGHFDAPVNTTLVGVGSKVYIMNPQTHRESVAYIAAITSTGALADQVTLDRAVGSGFVTILRYKYDFGAVPAGYTMSKGIIVHELTDINVSSQIVLLEAEFDELDDQ